MRATQSLYSLNRGVVSPLGLARMDAKKLALAAEIQTNFIPRVLGSMMLRAGWQFLGATVTNAAAKYLKFIFATDDTALLEMTAALMRIWINDALLTRPAVTTTIANGNFTTNLASWTAMDEAGATSAWAAPGYMSLIGTGSAFAIREQQVAVAGGNVGTEHGIRIVIALGPVMCRIGSTSGGEDYLKEASLDIGEHSISIVPAGNFYVRLFSRHARVAYVDSCNIEAAGVVTLPTPYGVGDLGNIRMDQSADVVYLACRGFQQRKVERRGTRPNARSWSVVRYAPEDGPFEVANTSPTTITPTALTGNIFLNSSAQLFNAQHVGALFSVTSAGQSVTATGAANGVATPSITVTGIGTERTFSIVISGDATASTVDLQRSFNNSTWANVGAPEQWTANVSTTYNDALDNQIVYYRLILTTRVAPDSVTMAMRIGSGSVRGVARVTTYVSATQVAAEVLSDMGGTDSSNVWQQGQWSDLNGWPTAVRLHEGRLWWAGQNGVVGTVSDDFESFDETTLGNSGPINRTIGSGPVDDINWMLSLKGLMLGAQGAEFSVRASSLDEPLSPTNFNMKSPSTQGSGAVEALKIDQAGYFVNRSGVKVFDFAFSLQVYDYAASCLMEFAPDIGKPGIVRMDVQRLPDTRLHCVRSDGTVVVAVMNKVEDVLAWIPVTTSGFVEDVVILPALNGNTDDQVYYVVKRTINGGTVRYLEKWAQESDCLGDKQYCYLADAYHHYSGAAATVITGLDHLEGASVVVWADGRDVGTVTTARPWTQTYTVAGGQITLPVAASEVVVGLGYTAQFKSAKLGFVAQGGSPLNQQKKGHHIGLVLANAYPKSLKFGPTLDDTGSLAMDDMPGIEAGTSVAAGAVTAYDENTIEFPGIWTTDMRVCLQAQAPRPVTVLAITLAAAQNS